jgi:hypothetical protein
MDSKGVVAIANRLDPTFRVPDKIISFAIFVVEKEVEYILKSSPVDDITPGILHVILTEQDLGEMTKHAVCEGVKAVHWSRSKEWNGREMISRISGVELESGLSDEALAYIMGVVEYFATEIIDTYIRKQKSIHPRRPGAIGVMKRVIEEDNEMRKLLSQITDLNVREIFDSIAR